MLHFTIKKQKWMDGLESRKGADKISACVWKVALTWDSGYVWFSSYNSIFLSLFLTYFLKQNYEQSDRTQRLINIEETS